MTGGPQSSLSSAPALFVLATLLALIGFTATITQIVLMRELMVVFNGKEISLGMMLGGWLLWTAIGSSMLGRLAARAQDPRKLMAFLQVLLAFRLHRLPTTSMLRSGALSSIGNTCESSSSSRKQGSSGLPQGQPCCF